MKITKPTLAQLFFFLLSLLPARFLIASPVDPSTEFDIPNIASEEVFEVISGRLFPDQTVSLNIHLPEEISFIQANQLSILWVQTFRRNPTSHSMITHFEWRIQSSSPSGHELPFQRSPLPLKSILDRLKKSKDVIISTEPTQSPGSTTHYFFKNTQWECQTYESGSDYSFLCFKQIGEDQFHPESMKDVIKILKNFPLP